MCQISDKVAKTIRTVKSLFVDVINPSVAIVNEGLMTSMNNDFINT